MLIIFGGLSATGKTTISRHLASELHAVHVRVDTIEQALRGEGFKEVQARDYEPWLEAQIVVDTAGESPEKSFRKTLSLIQTELTS